jgi:hypothetical protein
MKDVIVALSAIIAGIATLLFLSFVMSWPVMMLWNLCLVDAVSGIKEIGWVQGWGISTLCSILFKTNISTKKD